MAQTLVAFFSAFPPEVAVFLISMTPVLEQRVALPLAIIGYHMPIWKALLITFVGNIIPVLLLLFFADSFHRWVQKNSGTFFGRAWIKKLHKAQHSFSKYERFGLIGLAIFIILPIPGSGIFTGTMIAFLMGVPFRHSWPYITGAVLGSAMVTLVISVGVTRVF